MFGPDFAMLIGVGAWFDSEGLAGSAAAIKIGIEVFNAERKQGGTDILMSWLFRFVHLPGRVVADHVRPHASLGACVVLGASIPSVGW